MNEENTPVQEGTVTTPETQTPETVVTEPQVETPAETTPVTPKVEGALNTPTPDVSPVETQFRKEASECAECNGTGLKDPNTLCKACEGSGKVGNGPTS